MSFQQARGRLRADLRALRARGVRRAGGVGDDGRQRVDRLPRAVGLGREHARHLRERRLRRRPRDRARRPARARVPGARSTRRPRSRRRASTTIEALAELPRHRPAATSKAMPVDEGRRHARARARPRRRPARGGEARARARQRLPAGDRGGDPRAFGADPGSLGPVGFAGEIVADEALREGQFVAGANRTGWHLRGVEHGRDFEAALRRHPRAARGRRLPELRRRARASRPRSRSATSSSSARATRCRSARRSSTRTATEQPIVMGCYGIGPGRIMAAAVEQRHDEHGIVWPRSIAPYDVARRRARRGRRRGRSSSRERGRRATSTRPGSTCCSTTATSARARSSPTPT